MRLPITLLVENTHKGAVLDSADRFQTTELVFQRQKVCARWETAGEVVSRAFCMAKRAVKGNRGADFIVIDACGEIITAP